MNCQAGLRLSHTDVPIIPSTASAFMCDAKTKEFAPKDYVSLSHVGDRTHCYSAPKGKYGTRTPRWTTEVWVDGSTHGERYS